MLADALKSNKTLKWLNLAGTKGGEKGCKELGEALKINKSIRVLNLCTLNYSILSSNRNRRYRML